ncbi:hypothetical protein VFPBJ_01174 [Purpureocillium lilacinum]|uniref:Uncharacterized protein n=1 Tax=Purpureocillium lilacinum TaxID=33203 RepID=A0A179HAG3_PURLI|nr:hypothetical protein VFPBJ_01174 [Purpureocillium lilacinum]
MQYTVAIMLRPSQRSINRKFSTGPSTLQALARLGCPPRRLKTASSFFRLCRPS